MVVRSTGGSLAAALSRDTVAFEADEHRPDTCAGWDVVVAGHVEIVDDIDELVALADPARPAPRTALSFAAGRSG